MSKLKTSTLKTLILTDTAEKAKVIKKMIGRQYLVMSTDGFLQYLPKTRLAIDPENNFEPHYITIRGKGQLLRQIRKEAIQARRIYACTDNDPKGEAVAYQYCQLLGFNPSSTCRIVLNEITKTSVNDCITNARPIDMSLIKIYEARRAVNRLFTYSLQPILWSKIYRGISVTLPQAVILRLICEQEKNSHPIPEGISVDFNDSLTRKNLLMLSTRELDLPIGAISITIKQLYEGVKVDDSSVGLITWYKSDHIVPTDPQRTPESLKNYLPANQFKIYNLIWQYCNGKLPAAAPSKTMNQYNDYLLMSELERRGLPWSDTFSEAVCSMLKRKYIELTENGYKPTELGLSIMSVLKEYFTNAISDKFITKIETLLNDSEDKMTAVSAFWKQFNGILTKVLDKLGDDLTPKEPPVIETDVTCDKCGRKMIIRRSRYGAFLACSGYPDCKNTKPYFEPLEDNNCRCPKCNGHLNRRRLNKGRMFYRCENYPECDFTTWDEPQSKVCDVCGKTLFLYRFKDRAPMLYCGDAACPSRKEHPINKILENQQLKREAKEQKAAKKAES